MQATTLFKATTLVYFVLSTYTDMPCWRGTILCSKLVQKATKATLDSWFTSLHNFSVNPKTAKMNSYFQWMWKVLLLNSMLLRRSQKQQEGNGPIDLRRQGQWEIGMWCCMISLNPTLNYLGGHLTSYLKSATLITLVSMCVLPPMASEAMVTS